MPEPVLELIRIFKSYPGVQALSDVNLAVAPGEVVGLIGENGAGKSTLMRILGGVTAPSSGIIKLRGEQKDNLTVSEAIRCGVAFVHQELNLFDNLDVAANVFFGREQLLFGPFHLIDTAAMVARTKPLLERLGADFEPDTPVAALSLAQRQLVEIAKALSLGAEIVIMDEPTSSLTLTETNRLLEVIAELKAAGVSIIFITHRLNEIEQCADRVVALRDGRVVGTLQKAEIEHDRMIRLMIGRDLKALYTPPGGAVGEGVLVSKDIRTTTYPDCAVNFSLRRGEIVGLAGLVGSGRSELARTIFGIDRPIGGSVAIDGRPLTIQSPRDAIAHGIYLIPEDRKRSGLTFHDWLRIMWPSISDGQVHAYVRCFRDAEGVRRLVGVAAGLGHQQGFNRPCRGILESDKGVCQRRAAGLNLGSQGTSIGPLAFQALAPLSCATHRLQQVLP